MEYLMDGLLGSLIGAIAAVVSLLLANKHSDTTSQRQFTMDLEARRVERELPVVAELVSALGDEIGRDHLDLEWCAQLQRTLIHLNLHARDTTVEAWSTKANIFGEPSGRHLLYLGARMHVLALKVTAEFPSVASPRSFRDSVDPYEQRDPILTAAYMLGATGFDSGDFDEDSWNSVCSHWETNSKFLDGELVRLVQALYRWPSDQENVFDDFVDGARRIATSVLVGADLLVGGSGDLAEGNTRLVIEPKGLGEMLRELGILLGEPHKDQQRLTVERLARRDFWLDEGDFPDFQQALDDAREWFGEEFEKDDLRILLLDAGRPLDQISLHQGPGPSVASHFVHYGNSFEQQGSSRHLLSLSWHWPLDLHPWADTTTISWIYDPASWRDDSGPELSSKDLAARIDAAIGRHWEFLMIVQDLLPDHGNELWVTWDSAPTWQDLQKHYHGAALPQESITLPSINAGSNAVPIPQETQPVVSRNDLSSLLQARIKGQVEATVQVAERLILTRQGLDIRPERPNGVFLFVGPSGVGKTELAREVALHEFGSYDQLIRIDMSELSDRSASTRLIGPHPGYIGSDDPSGWLTTKVIAMPKCVVLLDEIEKAHPGIWNTFLQVFDTGRLTDGRGVTADFRETLIIMTSNLGTTTSAMPLGFGDPTARATVARDRVIGAVKSEMPPEFLNRIDDIIVFDALSSEIIAEIAQAEVDAARVRLAKEGWQLTIDPEVIKWLAESGYDPAYGARHLQRNIERELLTAVAKAGSRDVSARIVDGHLSVAAN